MPGEGFLADCDVVQYSGDGDGRRRGAVRCGAVVHFGVYLTMEDARWSTVDQSFGWADALFLAMRC